MGKKVVFTIVAENYLPLAQALEWSLNRNNSTEIDFYIFISDQINVNYNNDKIIPINKLNIEDLKDWAFKYNVTEFCTAIKPVCFKYLFKELGYEKAIYFDPDIFVFGDLKPIFSQLISHSAVVTPHYITPQVRYTGDQDETGTLFVGIYNFGFVAFKKTQKTLLILDWWENRLSDQCYGDKQDALHTDQRWGDFLPVYLTEELFIAKSLGYNLAPWNLFEREIYLEDNNYKVRNRLINTDDQDLIFVHFAGYDPTDLNLIHKDFRNLTIKKYPDYSIVRNLYNDVLETYSFKTKRLATYGFSQYSDGSFIREYHRRLYRSLVENGNIYEDPFDSNGDFYLLLKKKKMVSFVKTSKLNTKALPSFEKKVKKINFLLKLLLKIIGSDKYFLLMKFLNRYSRPENQLFLLNINKEKFY